MTKQGTLKDIREGPNNYCVHCEYYHEVIEAVGNCNNDRSDHCDHLIWWTHTPCKLFEEKIWPDAL